MTIIGLENASISWHIDDLAQMLTNLFGFVFALKTRLVELKFWRMRFETTVFLASSVLDVYHFVEQYEAHR